MIRRAFTMRLKPGSLAEYKYHHDNIWPELVAEIERSGIASITTFQRDLDLFLVSEISDEEAWDKLWNSSVHQRWAEVMQPLMHLREDGIVDAGELQEVFHIKTHHTTNGHASAHKVAAMFEPAAGPTMEPTIDDLLRASDELWREPDVATVVTTVEETITVTTIEAFDASPEAIPPGEMTDSPLVDPPSMPPPAPVPARKKSARPKKRAVTKPAPKKKSPDKKKGKVKPAKKGRKKAAKAVPKKSSKKKAAPKKAAKKSKAKKAKKAKPAGKKKRATKRG